MNIERVTTPWVDMKDAGFGPNYASHLAKCRIYEKGLQQAIESDLNRMPLGLTRATDYAQDVTPKPNIFQSLVRQLSNAISR